MELLNRLREYKEEGWVISQFHPSFPLSIWNYSVNTQYEGKWDEITLMARGLVINEITGEIVGRPFRKFFNLSENMHSPTSDFEVYEKMDGSLIIVFNYNDRWVVASRGSFTSDQAIAAQQIIDSMNTSILDVNTTYLYEFIAPWNRIVVNYGDVEKLVLLGAVKTICGTEHSYSHIVDISKESKVDVVRKYDGISDYSTLKDMIGSNFEGFVIKFSNNDRVKIKSDEYLRLHKIMTNISTTAVWEVLSNGGSMSQLLEDVPDEFYSKIKDYENNLRNHFDTKKKGIIFEYENVNELLGDVTQKEFALSIINNPNKRYFFALRNGHNIDNMIWNSIRPEFTKL